MTMKVRLTTMGQNGANIMGLTMPNVKDWLIHLSCNFVRILAIQN